MNVEPHLALTQASADVSIYRIVHRTEALTPLNLRTSYTLNGY